MQTSDYSGMETHRAWTWTPTPTTTSTQLQQQQQELLQHQQHSMRETRRMYRRIVRGVLGAGNYKCACAYLVELEN